MNILDYWKNSSQFTLILSIITILFILEKLKLIGVSSLFKNIYNSLNINAKLDKAFVGLDKKIETSFRDLDVKVGTLQSGQSEMKIDIKNLDKRVMLIEMLDDKLSIEHRMQVADEYLNKGYNGIGKVIHGNLQKEYCMEKGSNEQ